MGDLHVGLIPDGARRWARLRNRSLADAYRATFEVSNALMNRMYSDGVRAISLYLLSRDNLGRSRDELDAVFTATTEFLDQQASVLVDAFDVELHVAGDLGSVPPGYAEAARLLIDRTRRRPRRLYLLVAYSPAEELAACWRPGLDSMDELIAALWVPERLDLVLRTGGESLLSDFLPLQAGYARIAALPHLIGDVTWADVAALVVQAAGRTAPHGL